MTDLNKYGYSPYSLNPANISMYLRSSGWHEDIHSRTDKVSFWVREEPSLGEEYELIVPLNQNFSDYGKLVERCLKNLQEIYRSISLIELYHSIFNLSFDIIRIRIDNKDVGLPLEQGLAYIDGGHDIIQSSACSVKKKAPLFPSRKHKDINDFMQKVKLGHSEPGSYILKFLVPIPPKLETLHALEELESEDPFERKVTQQVIQSLNSLKIASNSAILSGSIDPFIESVKDGVSGNLCQAIAKMFESTSSESIRLDVEWAKNRKSSTSYSSLEISKNYFDVIQQAGRVFRSSKQDIELEGMVVRLDRDSELGTPTTTQVKICAVIENKQRQINIELTQEDYSLALKAFKEGIPVNCSGTLVQRGRSYIFEQYSSFSLSEMEC